MKKLMTYPVGLVLKTYMAYALFLVEREKRKQQREEKIINKTKLTPALGK